MLEVEVEGYSVLVDSSEEDGDAHFLFAGARKNVDIDVWRDCELKKIERGAEVKSKSILPVL